MRIFATNTPTKSATQGALMADMEEEVAAGRAFYRDGLIVEAYMDEAYTRTFMILEAESVEAAKAKFDTYPQVREGLIEFTYVPLIGMPAVAQVHEADGSRFRRGGRCEEGRPFGSERLRSWVCRSNANRPCRAGACGMPVQSVWACSRRDLPVTGYFGRTE